MRRSQVAGMQFFKTETFRGHVTVFSTRATGECPNCQAPTEEMDQHRDVRELSIETTEVFARLESWGLTRKDTLNHTIIGVNTPSEKCCGKCQHTTTSFI